ncbi:translation initiation factor IF-2-like [Lontra canadensis]|uniref:translation initiation factor IF-2-like n=1 Tax=Lontra canadensis TaxID=76717 RepID=UPI0013F36218|nr:translation initiation factor IF-2-like [Lontra canadensis]
MGCARRCPCCSFAPESPGAAGRDAPPGLGAAPGLLLALTAAALRAPPALGLRAGDSRGAPEVLLQGDRQLPTHLPVPAPSLAAPATPAPTASPTALRPRKNR